jgi:signal peptidase II
VENRPKRNVLDYIQLLVLGGIIIAFDQWTKHLVRANLMVGESWSPWEWLEPYARFRHIHNTGAAFGLFQDMNLVFATLAVIVAFAILYFYPQAPRHEWALRLAMVLQFGGAVGNLVDRIARGYVTDFISVGNFAIFNIADASITMGVVVLLLGMLIKDWLDKKEPEAQEAEFAPAPEGDLEMEIESDPARPILPEELERE